ncbi:MAG: U32 family peptidase [Clostridia bacterium]|nr:U32 family peptidase [Clostridia bacterium]
MKKVELLAPAGNFSKLKTALYYGADAVYLGGKSFSLRAYSNNFTNEELKSAVEYTHALNKKVYVTVNIFARNKDFVELENYFKYLQEIKVDAVIISDPGVLAICKKVAPNLPIHLSTQANTLNKYSAQFWVESGVERLILARELSLSEINEIALSVKDKAEIETFIHGAMCISYSGRCLLSNYFSKRDSNRGECVQACRWQYDLRESSKGGEFYTIEEDDKGTYVLNSKDLNMVEYIDKMVSSGITSFKIEGRMKGEYYLATVINAYRRAIDAYYQEGESYKQNELYLAELKKTFHRAFTTAYMLNDSDETVNLTGSQSNGNSKFMANVLGYDEEKALSFAKCATALK